MDKEVAAHLATLESHVARLEGILHVMLLELEAGSIQTTAAEIRAALPKLDED